MLISNENLRDLFNGFKTAFNQGFESARSFYREMAMIASSEAESETYAWLGQFPALREWIGDRQVQSLALHGYAIPNRKFESTIAVPRTKIEDDRYGVFTPFMQEMGRTTAKHPDELLFDLLKSGFTTTCYDGQYFFDTDHPAGSHSESGAVSVSNMTAGSSTPWYMLDCSRAIKPLVWQERIPYRFTALDQENDKNVFWQDEFIYGVRARVNAGFGLWQLAHGSKATLDYDGYAAARTAMMTLKGDAGRVLGVEPTHLVVPPSLERKGLAIVNAENDAAGASNVYRGTVKLIVAPWLEG